METNYRYWKVTYIDKWSNGKELSTEIHGYYNYDDVIKFFGLNDDDVYSYDIIELSKERIDSRNRQINKTII